MKQFFSTAFAWLKAKKWWLVLLFVAIGVFFLWRSSVEAKKPKLAFITPTRQTITQSLDASGVVDAKEKALLRFAAGGKLTYLGVKEGDTVKKYQTIARIDARDLQKRLTNSLALYSQARLDWDQLGDDTKDRALPKKEIRGVEKEQFDLNMAVTNVEIQDIAISNTVMSSPIAGVVVTVPTTVSGVVLGATDGFGIINPETLIFSAEVDEADIAKVSKGQKTILTLDAYPDEPIETTVSFIGYRAIETSSGTAFVVELPITDARALEKYRLGMNGDAKIELATKADALTIPLSATKERDTKVYVDVKTGPNQATEKEITIGIQTDDLVEVTSGLSELDEIVLP